MATTSEIVPPPIASTSSAAHISAVAVAEQQWFFTQHHLDNAPSITRSEVNVTIPMELQARRHAVQRLWGFKDVFSAPQIVVSTAATYIHRFYMRESIQNYQYGLLAAAAFFLASKVEENQRRLRDVCLVAVEFGFYDKGKGAPAPHHMVGRSYQSTHDEESSVYKDIKKKLLFYEESLLRVLCMDLVVKQPHWKLVQATHELWQGDLHNTGKEVAKVGWGIINDSFFTPICVVHRADVIAAAALVSACVQLDIPLPSLEKHAVIMAEAEEGEEPEPEAESRTWLEIFEVGLEELTDAIKRFGDGYQTATDSFVSEQGMKTSELALRELATLIIPASPVPAPFQAPDSPSEKKPLLSTTTRETLENSETQTSHDSQAIQESARAPEVPNASELSQALEMLKEKPKIGSSAPTRLLDTASSNPQLSLPSASSDMETSSSGLKSPIAPVLKNI